MASLFDLPRICFPIPFLVDLLTPLRQYQKLIDTGVLRGDDHQTRIIQKLQDLHDKLLHYDPPHIPRPSHNTSLVCTSTVDMFGI
jgi:predicted ATPase